MWMHRNSVCVLWDKKNTHSDKIDECEQIRSYCNQIDWLIDRSMCFTLSIIRAWNTVLKLVFSLMNYFGLHLYWNCPSNKKKMRFDRFEIHKSLFCWCRLARESLRFLDYTIPNLHQNFRIYIKSPVILSAVLRTKPLSPKQKVIMLLTLIMRTRLASVGLFDVC